MPKNSNEYDRIYGKKYRQKYPAKRREYMKEYDKQPHRIKYNKMKCWKQIGIRCNGEWEEVYDWYSKTTNCDICDKLFKESTDKCLDHNHDIDGYNIRGILCSKCNHYTNEI